MDLSFEQPFESPMEARRNPRVFLPVVLLAVAVGS